VSDPETRDHRIPLTIERQPDDTTCGPTCLQAIYRHFGDGASVRDLAREVPALEGGGTLGVLLANHALERSYEARIVTWNLQVFDPTWFRDDRGELVPRLRRRAAEHADPRTRVACEAYARFVELGGRVELRDLTPRLLASLLRGGLPVLTGLSATYLYRDVRELPDTTDDDVHGDPVGHFVVLSGYLRASREALVTDPLHPNPLSESQTYPVPLPRLVGAIYLGVLTHDANLLVLRPRPSRGRR
jgi:hypothetical protein